MKRDWKQVSNPEAEVPAFATKEFLDRCMPLPRPGESLIDSIRRSNFDIIRLESDSYGARTGSFRQSQRRQNVAPPSAGKTSWNRQGFARSRPNQRGVSRATNKEVLNA